MDLSFLKSNITILLLFAANSWLSAQDLLEKANGSRLMVEIIEVTDDSIKFKNAYTDDNFVFTLAKSEIKFIEYYFGDTEYFEGSYQNLSIDDTTSAFNKIDFGNNDLVVDSVLITFQNLFSQQNLVFDFTHYKDTNLIVDKGKISFIFQKEKQNFTERCYPTDDKIIFVKFNMGLSSSKKHYQRLSETKLLEIIISLDQTHIALPLSKEQSNTIMEIFKRNFIAD